MGIPALRSEPDLLPFLVELLADCDDACEAADRNIIPAVTMARARTAIDQAERARSAIPTDQSQNLRAA